MASRSVPEGSLDELERVARLLEDELAGWRRRTLKAESELEDARSRVPSVTTGDLTLLRQRVAELEAENQRLTERIGLAREQLEQLRTRLRFVGEQTAGDLR